MRCKRCKTKTDVVKYGRGLTYKGVGLPAGGYCHDCIRALKKSIDELLAPVADPEETEARASAHHDACAEPEVQGGG